MIESDDDLNRLNRELILTDALRKAMQVSGIDPEDHEQAIQDIIDRMEEQLKIIGIPKDNSNE